MELPVFSTLSANNDKGVPFKLSEESLMDWLRDFEYSNNYYLSCRQILAALHALNAREVEPNLRFHLLDSLGVAIIPLVRRLEQPLLAGTIPLESPEQANYELIVSTYAALAQGYWRNAQDIAALPQSDAFSSLLAKSLFAGLGMLKKLLLHTVETYERPYKGFWNACYQFYRMAERYKLLEVKVEEVKRPATIAANFKSLLVFYLSGPSQFNPRDMKELLKFLEQYVDSAFLSDSIEDKERPYFFKFSFESDEPPGYSKNHGEVTPGAYYLSAVKIAKTAYDILNHETSLLNETHTLKRPQLAIVVKSLGMGAHRKFIRLSVNKNYFGIVGYDNILSFLRKSAASGFIGNVEPFDPRVAGTWKMPDLELMPMPSEEENTGWKKVVEANDDRHVDVQLTWNQSQQSDSPVAKQIAERFGEFNIVDSNVKGYGILSKEKNLKAALGDFIGIINSDGGSKNRLEIGIIRRIAKPEAAMISLGVELIAYEAEATCIYRPGNLLTKSWAVVLHGIPALKQSDSLIFNSHAFKIGEEICLERSIKIDRCAIKKILYATPTVVHAEVDFMVRNSAP